MSFFLFYNEQVRGPYSEAELRDMLEHREIERNVPTSRGAESDWEPLHSVLGMENFTPQQPAKIPAQKQNSSAFMGTTSSPGRHATGAPQPHSSTYSDEPDHLAKTSHTRLWQVAAGLLILYVVLILITVSFGRTWNDGMNDPRSMIRLVVRVFGSFALIYGLISMKSWAYWMSLVYSFVMAAFGIFAVMVINFNLAFSGSPFPHIDTGLLFATILSVVALFVVLLILPLRENSRK